MALGDRRPNRSISARRVAGTASDGARESPWSTSSCSTASISPMPTSASLRRVDGGRATLPEASLTPGRRRRSSRTCHGRGDSSTPRRFLTFAVAVHRTAAHLDHASYVEEAWTARQRIPVFDVVRLRELLADPTRCFFPGRAAGLLHPRLERCHLGADPAGLATAAIQRARPGRSGRTPGGRRPRRAGRACTAVSGDLALFLTGVFPDHAITLGLGGRCRWATCSGRPVPGGRPTELGERKGTARVPWALASIGGRRTPSGPRGIRRPSAFAVVDQISERFTTPGGSSTRSPISTSSRFGGAGSGWADRPPGGRSRGVAARRHDHQTDRTGRLGLVLAVAGIGSEDAGPQFGPLLGRRRPGPGRPRVRRPS